MPLPVTATSQFNHQAVPKPALPREVRLRLHPNPMLDPQWQEAAARRLAAAVAREQARHLGCCVQPPRPGHISENWER